MDNPYSVLGVDRSSTKAEIEGAYRRLQMRYHPDRKTGNREMYDRATAAYAEIQKHPALKLVPVEEIERAYRNSPEETKDIVGLYNKHRGSVSKIIDSLLLSNDSDEERLRGIIDSLIEKGQVRRHRNYRKIVAENASRRERRAREADMAEKIAKDMGIDLDAPLEDILNRRQRQRVGLLQELERKYLGPSEKRKR